MLVKLHYKTCSECRVFPLPCCPWAGMEGLNEIRTAISSENIQLLQNYILTYRKKLKKVVFVEEERLHKKISNKDEDYGAMGDFPEHAVRQYDDLTELK